MYKRSSVAVARVLLAILALTAGATALGATEWQVAKSSGEVWLATPKAQPVSLAPEIVLRAGDKIQTGRNGRVLLIRGAEAILIAPNSVVSLPTEQKGERATTILHQAGSIVLEVEKKNVDHFEVETPYLAAVVKGTRFSVTVGRHGTEVRVSTGKVHVSDFKTGQFALVSAGQAAHVASLGNGGLTLGGTGQLGPVRQGAPRKSHLERVPVPAKGLGPPRAAAASGAIHACRRQHRGSRAHRRSHRPRQARYRGTHQGPRPRRRWGAGLGCGGKKPWESVDGLERRGSRARSGDRSGERAWQREWKWKWQWKWQWEWRGTWERRCQCQWQGGGQWQGEGQEQVARRCHPTRCARPATPEPCFGR